MLDDAGLTRRLAEAASLSGQNLPDWRETARLILEAARFD
jgi:hypothetical protein